MLKQALVVIGMACAFAAQAQLPLDAPIETGTGYNRAIPTPDDSIFVRLGTRHLRSHEADDYFRAVDAASDRVIVRRYGQSYGGRHLSYAVVSSPENLKNLDSILNRNRRLTYEAPEVTKGEMDKMPVVLWAGFGIHGNEASVVEAACLSLYHLAAGTDAKIKKLLDEAVIVILPNMNPDGRDRFVFGVNNARGATFNADGQDWERSSSWPGGRVSHYWFDLNRDWMPLTHPESFSRQELLLEFRPQVVLDYHEMGNRGFFFQPGVATRNNPLQTAENRDLTQRFANNTARALEGVGTHYFSGERFDDFYIGKGSTYADMVGAVGILYEQEATSALVSSGSGLTFAESIRNQVATFISVAQSAQAMRLDLLEYQRNFCASALQPGGTVTGYQVADDDAGRNLIQLVMAHGIRVRRQPEGYVIPVAQPLGTLVRAMFDPITKFTDDEFYDISAWSLQYAMGARVTPISTTTEGKVVSEALLDEGAFAAAVKPVGHVIKSGRMGFHALVADLMRRGRPVRFAEKAIGHAQPGDVFVPIQAGDEALMKELALAHRVEVIGVPGQTGEVVSWAGGALTTISPRKIALLVGTGVDANNAGEIWHHFDQKMGHNVVLLPASATRVADLADYNVILFAGGSLPAAWSAAVATWVQGGGTFIASSSGATWVASTDLWKLDTVRYTADVRGLAYGDIGEERGRHDLPGSIFRVEFDATHPLTFGGTQPYSFRESGVFLATPPEPGSVVARYTADPLVAGYVSEKVLPLAGGRPAILAKQSGAGRIVLFADNPFFRGFFTAQSRTYLNAVFFSGAF